MTRTETAPGAARDEHRPVGVERSSSTRATLRRTFTEFKEDGLTDWAAALTYYGLLSLFPALLVLSAIVGLVASPDDITDVILEIAPASAADTLSGPIESITSNAGSAGAVLGVGLLGALWGASGYVAAFGRASNVIYETLEGRPFWKLRPLQVLITLVMVVLLALVTMAIVLTGPIVDAVAEPLGIGSTAVTAWEYGKWPVVAAAIVLIFSILYYTTPNVRQRGLTAVIPGVVVALVLWIVASVGFAFYVANFGSYDRTYGTLGGVIVLLVWLWISNLALLLGAELNAERERSAEIEERVPGAGRQIRLPRHEAADRPDTE